MKLSEYIEALQSKLDEQGDLECYYASDPEGNHYHKVHWAGTKRFTTDPLTETLFSVYSGKEEYNDEYEEEDRSELLPFCIIN